ncbi:MAG TPA: cob(I)yrinic acid a,c-diamide adenosyltransferase [Prolixibacteraceae bacterium]|nr:cob(I)yrinic acid a,c-diamide adenosyltransferase [Prolixibacteraceae bacterium]HPR61851.1 cob(I)yrinic acid a,c-diamide adenosyltransferase [Prolixibacteraceae bacterium]
MEKSFKIYTKTGDDGTSGLIGGTRVKKSDMRLEAYGTVDELNSWIGVLKSEFIDQNCTNTLEMIQNKLFVIGSKLATDYDKYPQATEMLPCNEKDIEQLENEIDRMQQQLEPLKNFILPGGNQQAAFAHIARTVCRRAERRISSLDIKINHIERIIIFVNRLSDYLFVLARYINNTRGIEETKWITHKS